MDVLFCIMDNRRLILKRLALCIPTYKRPQVVEDFLKTCATYYLDAGIDIYYYDSSSDSDTEKIINKYKNDNLYYIRMSADIPSNMKVYKIYSGYGLKRKYDFIWVCGDAIQYAQVAIDNLMERLDSCYDIIQMDCRDYGKIGDRIYTDYNEYLRDCAWELTLYGSAILNSDTILKNVDWDYYEKTYSKENLINFSHVSFYFTRICEIKSFKAFHISVDNKYFKSSYYKRKSGWYDDAFFILCVAWVDTIESLPECYKYKEEAILKHGQYVMIRNVEDIVLLKEQGIFSYKVYKQYRDRLGKVCPVKEHTLRTIAVLPNWILNIYFGKKSRKYMLDKLFKFCRDNKRIYIYGAGQYGHAYALFLRENGIRYRGYVVTSVSDNPVEFVDESIYNIKDIDNLDKVGIIVAVGTRYAPEVMNLLNSMNIKNIYYEKDLYREIVG